MSEIVVRNGVIPSSQGPLYDFSCYYLSNRIKFDRSKYILQANQIQ